MSNEIHPAGRFPAICRSIQFNEAGTGNTQVVIGFEICEIAEGPEGPQYEATGTFQTYFGAFTDKATVHTVKALRACGWTGDDLAELPELADAGSLSEPVSLVIVHEEYKGEWKAKVKWVNTPNGGTGKIKLERPLEGGDLRDFAQRMKSRIRAESGTTGGARRAAPSSGNGRGNAPHPNAPGSTYGSSAPDDDIPF